MEVENYWRSPVEYLFLSLWVNVFCRKSTSRVYSLTQEFTFYRMSLHSNTRVYILPQELTFYRMSLHHTTRVYILPQEFIFYRMSLHSTARVYIFPHEYANAVASKRVLFEDFRRYISIYMFCSVSEQVFNQHKCVWTFEQLPSSLNLVQLLMQGSYHSISRINNQWC